MAATDQHKSSFVYEASGHEGQHDCEMSDGAYRLRQIQRRLKVEQTIDMCQKYRDGATVYALSRAFGIDRRTVSDRLKAAGILMRFQSPSDETIAEIVRLYASGLSCATVGMQLELSPQTVLRYLKNLGVTIRHSRYKQD